ncbi:Dynein heavy chain 5, axonemal [Schistosoma haematobium]|uniref:Dynein heavy chain 5, axonemal n=3 Tax=Schistosoma TaxID=6181 RepID=A0A922LQ08_SCHHA|nr:Dynein heavy chain 5, axonemal [Schistosoma haematobium]KAH9591062.1 Dynein heavy chain 5, axonemal [Schistosoma haematobium]
MLHESRGHKEVRDNASNFIDSTQDKPEMKCLDRELRKSLVDSRFHFLFEKISLHFKIDKSYVLECILDGEQSEKSDVNERIGVFSRSLVPVRPRVVVSTVADAHALGSCAVFTKVNAEPQITAENISKEVNFLTTDLAKDFLNAFGNLLDSLMLPQLQAIPNKVFVEKTVPIDVQKLDLVEYTKKFVKILKETSEFLENRFHFKSFQNKSFEKIQSTLDTKRISSVVNPDMLKELEIYAETWINQLEQVMVIADQIRKEADNTGPRVELEYWRRRMITFNTIFEEMNKHNCKIVFGILSTFNCPLVKRWLKLESQVMDYTNEAKNNLKFLSTLEEYCEPLYRCDPVGMLDSIPKLVTMIRLVYEISTFYNTQEKITSLFVKVTNQMIFACKAYVTNNYQSTIWTEETEIILKKIIDCCNLHQVYKNSFQRIKTELAAKPNSKQFDLSEIHIFGKYDLFCQRLGEINDIFQMISSYSCLLVSKIEKLDPLIEMYNFAVNKLRNSEFDFLDQRKTEVDDCIMEFKKKMSDIRTSLRSLLDTEMNRHHDLQRSLRIIGQFEKLDLPNLGVDEAHIKSLHRFSQLIEHVGKEYSKFKASPPIGRDIPPIAGKISWAKELYRRIESPMLMLTDKIKLMRSKEGKEITKKYNKLAEVLITYEMVHYRNWINQISFAKVGLRDPLLYQDEGTNRIIVALDPEILVVYREIELLSKWGLDIPEIAVELSQKETQLKLHYNKLKSMLTSINEIEVNLDPMFIKLMRAQFAHLQNLLKPGLSLLNWTSLGINHFIGDVTSYINQLKLLSERANDLKKYRIEQILNEISNITLCELSDSEPWTIDYFLEHTNYLCSKAGDILQIKSQVIQDSVHELIDMLCGAYRLQLMQEEEKDERNITCMKGSGKSTLSSQKSIYPESAVSRTTGTKSARECRKRLVEDAALRVLEHFHQRTVDTLTKLIRNTLDNLRKCLTLPSILAYDSVNSDGSVQLYFSCHAQLSIPSIILHPSLDDFQKALNTATHLIISVSRHISVWDLRLRNPYGLKEHSEIEESFSSIEEVKKSSQTDSSTHSGNELTREITVSSGTNELITYTTDERFSVADDEYENKGDENYFNKISQNKEINKLRGMLTNAFSSIQQSAKSSLRHFDQYKSLWEKSKTEEFDKFMSNNPSVTDFEEIIQQFYEKDQLISNEPDVCDCSPLAIYTNHLKDGLLAETRNWRLEYGRLCSSKFKTQVESLFATIEKYEKILSRPINDLDDIRILMNALKDLREMEANVDLQLGPIEESYSLLAKHSIPVDKEETDKADTLRYEWEKLCKQMLEVQNQLVDVQPEFRNNLLENITTFNENCSTFYDDYDKVGPMVRGIPPREASDRLIIFQNRFDNLYRSYITYSAGEQLFGLPITEHTRLDDIRKQLNLLQKLYLLYNSVLNKTAGYYDIPWSDVKIDVISQELQDFENRCLKLPKALREYPAYDDLRQTLANFDQIIPLLELMTNPAMRERHWKHLATLTGRSFNVDDSEFTLRNILEAPLLKHYDDVEDICISAIKEQDIERKLINLKSEWSAQEFEFVQFKHRGELLLRGDHTLELISLMEDSLMALASLLSNRYNAPFRKDIQNFISRLSNSNEIIEQWLAVQNLWIYLEAVFIGGDIARQLPQEAKRFANVDKSWCRIMQRAHETTHVLTCCIGDEMLSHLLPHLMEQLELCQKSLTGCYITLAQAIGMSMGGSPAGPAGTGKTETVKDMGRCLGKYVIVSNCSDQMDFRGLGRIFKGLAQSGSWGCFDEFNRIELPVLSVAAQQIAIILTCKKERKPQFVFTDGEIITMNPQFGIFLTMNPGYAGRQELPENLKINFRTVAMMVPDRQIIIRVKLASCGFIENIISAQKFYTLYKLCEEQLSKQIHYDFGLRNILSVLRTLGAVKRANPNDTEFETVMRVLRDMNLSKLVGPDEPLFLSLLDDLFPGISLDKGGYPDLEKAIKQNLAESHLISHPPWFLKVIQLYETQRVRHGMMTLGPSGTGKSCCIQALMKAMTECFEPHREMRMNPKAITASQMFGRLDVATNDWTDGIFSTLWRRTLKAKKGEHIWLILDGPVDALWIENLNSVLDDSKLLTLANGDRIPMAPCCKIIFEVDNVDNASPATVSRNGMVYISTTTLPWLPILQGWLMSRGKSEADQLLQLFTASFESVYQYATRHLNFKMSVLEAFVIRQACDILSGILPKPEEKDSPSITFKYMERIYIFALMWSIGAFLEGDDRAKFETYLRKHETVKFDLPEISTESHSTIFDYLVNDLGEWIHWDTKVDEFLYPTDHTPEYSSLLVPNVDNVRTEFLIDLISKQQKCVLLIGEQGTAKTVILNKYLSSQNPEFHIFKTLNFSSVTTPLLFQRAIESFVDKRMGSTYGPPAGRKMTVFIDDISMPLINEWGDQVTNEIVRQLIEMKGFYNLEKPGDFTSIVDVQFLAAMIHPGSGRNDIPHRLKRHFCIFNCTLPSNTSIDKIFGAIAQGHYCPERGFTDSAVTETVKLLVPLTRILWQKIKNKMLPTPAKFHYIFNLRDLSRIWQGMIGTVPEVINNTERLMMLWRHECSRVLADRFVSADDHQWFHMTTKRLVKEELGMEYMTAIEGDPSYFVNFLRDPPEPTGDEPEDYIVEVPRIYEPIESFQQLTSRLEMFLHQYNESVRGARMNLVLFRDTLTQIVRISRIIYMPRGNALLVGVGGSGKQSFTKLASYIAGYQTFQITLTRSYNTTNLMEDLKFLYRTAGQKGRGITFIFTDQEIKDEAFLEYLNNVLSSGIMSNLFTRDETDEILQDLIPFMKKEHPRLTPTNENLNDYFLSRTRKNLHVVLCFSPVGEKFRIRSLKFPGLLSGCTTNWFHRWPKEALISVANHYLIDFPIVCKQQTKTALINTMGIVHDGIAEACIEYFSRYRRQTHVTPKSYLSFLCSYKSVYSQQHNHYANLAQRMDGGLQKLVEAQESVAQLSKELAVKEKDLDIANKEAEEVLRTVTVQQNAATEVRNKVQVVKDKAQAIVDDIDREKVLAEAKLEAAKPALQEAEDALNTIKPGDIATVRRLGKPPHLIMRIMDCVLLLFQRHLEPYQPDPERTCPKPNWSESLKLMTNTGFLSMLMSFPKDTINGETVELLEPYLNMEDYTLEVGKKVCGNVAGLLSWTKAMAYFYTINKDVLPMKDNLIKQEARLAKAMLDLNDAQAILDEKELELAKVQAVYEEALRKKNTLLEDAELCRRKMTAASKLIGSLGDEQTRWTEQSQAFKENVECLVGDVLVATGFLSYCGPFNQEFRQMLYQSWQRMLRQYNIPGSTIVNLISMLTRPTQLGEWKIQGLPSDELSVQNGIIVDQASRYPLLIDPQGQGKSWIKSREQKHDLIITTLWNKYFRQHLEDALSTGRPLLIEDIGEDLDPAMDNVLEKNFIKQGSIHKVKIADKEVDVLPCFRLYITTKLPNPSFTPEISARTSIIDFTVTMKGLEEQLLGRVILSERHELEAQRVQLMLDVQSNKTKIKELEDNLLSRLASVQGSLVDDVDLIDVLSSTKLTASDVSRKLEIASETEMQITSAREEYRPIATRGSVLYFLIVEMSLINCMYQTSLRQFLALFDQSLSRSEKSPITTKRITNVIDYMTYDVWRYIIRGLYEVDKSTFSLLLALKIDMQAGRVRHEEFQCFIKGGASLDLNTVKPKPFKWITDMTWLNLVALSSLNQFASILDQVVSNERGWRQWTDKTSPELENIPDGYQSNLDTFRRLLIIRAWCPDRITNQANIYVGDCLGRKFAEGFVLDLDGVYHESTPLWPIVGLLSTGSDPTTQIELLAKKYRVDCKIISMGQGQEIHAKRLVSNLLTTGGWILLQNCHLSLAYVAELLSQITEIEHIHPEFRLWVTTEVHTQFPISFLQTSIKFTNEPPQGIRAGIKRTYATFTQDYLDINNRPQWKPMIYAISFLHTTVQERRKFGSLGWNIAYEFNTSDLNASLQFVQNHLDDMDPKLGIDWKCVTYMLGEIQYGGRVIDDFDNRLLNTYCKLWFNENLFNSEFEFAPGYKIPHVQKLSEFINAINEIPLYDSPQAFGLHENVNITYQSKKAKVILDCILNVQPKDANTGASETREDVVRRMAMDMLDKLPPNYIQFEVNERLNQMGALQPMNIFLRQELNRIQKLLTIMRENLVDLKLAIDGTIVMSEQLRQALDCMYDARIPNQWKKLSWESSTLGFWFTELIERNHQFYEWLYNGRPVCFWMTGFFNPQGFLTAIRQEVTRSHKGWALDTVTLWNDVTRFMKDDIQRPPTEGAYIHGLFLEGAEFDQKNLRLTESKPKILYQPMPVIHIQAVDISKDKEISKEMLKNFYVCPVYKKPCRTNLTYVTSLYLRCPPNKSVDHWVLRGVALLCDIR